MEAIIAAMAINRHGYQQAILRGCCSGCCRVGFAAGQLCNVSFQQQLKHIPMPLLKQSESTYTPVPVGNHPSRCYGMVSLGTQAGKNPKFPPTFQVVLMFELPNESIEVNGEKKPMIISKFLNAYLGSPTKPSKTNLFLSSWRSRPFNEQELKGFDISKVVGCTCLLNVVHVEKNGKTREEIASISPLPKGMTMNGQVNPSVVYEIEQGRDDTFKTLPEWMQKMIEKCEEWVHPQAADDAPQEDATDSDNPPF